MGLEYAAPCNAGKAGEAFKNICESLASYPQIRVVPKEADNKLDFVWSTHINGEGWPVDGSVSLEEYGIYLIFHVWNRDNKEAFFEHLRASGLNEIEFEEL